MPVVYSSIWDILTAVGSLGSLVLAVAVYMQGKKIKTLTDLVSEQARQTKEFKRHTEAFENSNRLQNILTYKDRLPIFVNHVVRFEPYPPRFEIYYKNDGQIAHDVRAILAEDYVGGKVVSMEQETIEENHVLQITIKDLANTNNEIDLKGFIIFKDNFGNIYNQAFIIESSKSKLSFPILARKSLE